jgi:hypothetical protein
MYSIPVLYNIVHSNFTAICYKSFSYAKSEELKNVMVLSHECRHKLGVLAHSAHAWLLTLKLLAVAKPKSVGQCYGDLLLKGPIQYLAKQPAT